MAEKMILFLAIGVLWIHLFPKYSIYTACVKIYRVLQFKGILVQEKVVDAYDCYPRFVSDDRG